MDTSGKITSAQTPANSWTASLWFQILLVIALGLGVFFRLAGLGNKMYSHDEAYTSLYAAGYRSGYAYTSLWDGKDKPLEEIRKFVTPSEEKNIWDTYTVLARFEPHESPIFFLLSHYWMRVFGSSPAAMRGLAVLFSLLSIPALYWLSRELFVTSGTALLATALFALSPYQVLFAQDARPYSALVFSTLFSSAALFLAMRKNKMMAWLLYSITLIFGIYCHQLFALVAVVHALYFAGRQTLLSPKAIGGFLSAAVIALLAFAPWLFHIITRWEQAAARLEWVSIQLPWYRYIQRWMLNFSSPLLDLELGPGNLVAYALRALLLLLVFFAWVYLLRHGSFRQNKFLLLLFLVPAGFLIIPDVIMGGIRSIGGRYFVPPSIVTILVVAYFLSDSLDRTRPDTKSRWKFLIVLLAMAAVVSNINSLYAETWWNKKLGRVQPELIDEINQDQTVLLVSGYNSTNLGEVLALSLEVDSDIHFILNDDPSQVSYPENYKNVYWLPSSQQEVRDTSAKEGLQISEVIPGILWKMNDVGK